MAKKDHTKEEILHVLGRRVNHLGCGCAVAKASGSAFRNSCRNC